MSKIENNASINILESENISKSIITVSWPMMITGLSDALYSMVDSIFVGKFIGEKALAALAVNTVIYISLLAIASLYNTGLSSIISRALGAKNYQKVTLTIVNGIVLAMISTTIISLVMLVNLDEVLTFMGSSEDILHYSREYAQITLWFGFVVPIKGVLDSILRARGEVKLVMKFSLLGACTNILLDALFIIYFGWGIQGAAWATVISQLIVSVMLLFVILKVYNVHFRLYYLKQMEWSWIKEIYSMGSSSFLRSFTFAIMGLSANRALAVYGSMAVAAFGVVNRILHLAYQPIFGSNLGVQALIGYNYGAQNYNKVRDIIITSIIFTTGIGFCFSMLFVWAPQGIFHLFTDSSEIVLYAKDAIRISGLTFFLYGFQICSTGALLAMGHPKEALFLSIFRPILMVLFMNTLPYFFAVKGVWYNFPFTDIVSSIATFYIVKKELVYLRNKSTLLKDVKKW